MSVPPHIKNAQEFTITEDHLKLLKSAYVGWDNGEWGSPAICCKRPYGNGDVVRDIAEILGWMDPQEEYEWDEIREQFEHKATEIHHEMFIVLQIGFSLLKFETGTYKRVGEYSQKWVKQPITVGEQAMIRVAGKEFYCRCGCNVFSKNGNVYTCNACNTRYGGE